MSLLHIMTYLYAPYHYPCAMHVARRSPACSLPGLSSELLDGVLRAANISFTQQSLNTSLSDLFARLNRENNTCLSPLYVPTAEKLRLFKATASFFDGTAMAIHSKPSAPTSMHALGFLNVFSNDVLWAFIFAYIILTQSVFRMLPKRQSWLGLFLAVFLGLYGSGLLAQLLMHQEHPFFTDFPSMMKTLRAGKAQIALNRGFSEHDIFVRRPQPTNPEINELVQLLKVNQPTICASHEQCMQLVTQRPFDLIYLSNTWASAKSILVHNRRSDKTGTLVGTEMPELATAENCMLCTLDVPNKTIARINQAVHYRADQYIHGIVNRYNKLKTLSTARQSNEEQKANSIISQLSLPKLFGVFLMLAAGLGASLLWVGLELCYYKREQEHQSESDS